MSRSSSRVPFLVATLLVAAPLLGQASVRAQDVPVTSLRPGDVIRVTDTRGWVQRGVLVSVTSETLTWKPGAAAEPAAGTPASDRPLASIARLERSGGKERLGWKGFAVTAGSLIAVGAVIGAVTYEPCESTEFLGCLLTPESRGQASLWGATAGGMVGIPIGAAVALFGKREVWADVGVEARPLTPSLSLDPSGRVSLGMSLPLGH